MPNQQENKKSVEKYGLQRIQKGEWLAEKKINVYARLLMDPTLAKAMEKLATRHEERRRALLAELGLKPDEKEDEV